MNYCFAILIVTSFHLITVTYSIGTDIDTSTEDPVCEETKYCAHLGHILRRTTTRDCCKRCEITHGCVGYTTKKLRRFPKLSIQQCVLYDTIESTNTTTKKRKRPWTCGTLSASSKHAHRNLYRKYSLPPPPYLEEALQIYLEVFPSKITKVDVNAGILSMAAYTYLTWTDRAQQWDPKDIDIQSIQIPIDVLWLPDIGIYDPVEDKWSLFKETDRFMHATVHSDGRISIMLPVHFDISLRANELTDNQFEVSVYLGGWSHHQAHYNVSTYKGPNTLAWYKENACWRLDSIKTDIEEFGYYSNVTFQVMGLHLGIEKSGLKQCLETPTILLEMQSAQVFVIVMLFFYLLSKCARFLVLLCHYYEQSQFRPTINPHNIVSIVKSAMIDRNILIKGLSASASNKDAFSECNSALENNYS